MKFRTRAVAATLAAIVGVGVTAAGAYAYSYGASDPTKDTKVYKDGLLSRLPTLTENSSADITRVVVYDNSTHVYVKVYVRNLVPKEGQKLNIALFNLKASGNYSDIVDIRLRYYTDGSKSAQYYSVDGTLKALYATRSDSGNYTLVRVPKSDIRYVPDQVTARTNVYYSGGRVFDEKVYRF